MAARTYKKIIFRDVELFCKYIQFLVYLTTGDAGVVKSDIHKSPSNNFTNHFMRKSLVLILSLLLFYSPVQSNTRLADSLELILHQSPADSLRLKVYDDLVWEYRGSDPLQAKNYAKEALKIAKKNGNLRYMATAYSNLGVVESDQGNFDLAIDYYNEAGSIWDKLHNLKGQASVSNNIGLSYFYKGDYALARKFHEQSLAISTRLKNENGMANSYNNIAIVEQNTGNYDRAVAMSFNALKIRKKQKDQEGIASIYQNLSNIYNLLENYQLALNYGKKALDLWKSTNNKYGWANTLNSLGITYQHLKLYQNAIDLLNQSASMHREIGNAEGIANAQENIGEVLLDSGKVDAGINYIKLAIHTYDSIGSRNAMAMAYDALGKAYLKLKELSQSANAFQYALKLAGQNGNRQLASDCYKALGEIENMRGDHQQAYSLLLNYSKLRDSLFQENKLKLITNMETNYRTKEKEDKIKLLMQQQQISQLEISSANNEIKNKNIFLFIGLFIFLLAALSAYSYIQQQRMKTQLIKAETIRMTEEKERTRIAKDLHDDLGSGLSKINLLTEIAKNKLQSNSEVAQIHTTISETTRQLVDNMRELIWILNTENATLPNLISRIREHSVDFLDEFGKEVKLDFPNTVENKPLSKGVHRQVLLVMKELLNNIVKHADATTVELALSYKNEQLSITVKDNGKGLRPGWNEGGNGIKNIRARTQSLNGRFDISGDSSGTLVKIDIPIT